MRGRIIDLTSCLSKPAEIDVPVTFAILKLCIIGRRRPRFVYTIGRYPDTESDNSRAMSKPRYLQIKTAILEEIQTGELRPDDKIPSEHKLANAYSVSRLTVQRAIRELVSEGLLRRTQGSGTFVNPFTHRFSLVEVRDVVDEIEQQGGVASSEVLMQRRLVPPPEIDELLELEPEQEVFHVAVLQSMDGVPVAHEERFAIVDVYSDFLDQDFSKRSVFDYLAARSVLEDIENVVAAVNIDRKLALLLEIEADEPCIQVQRRNWYQGRCVTLTRITYAGSRQVLASRYRPYGKRNETNTADLKRAAAK